MASTRPSCTSFTLVMVFSVTARFGCSYFFIILFEFQGQGVVTTKDGSEKASYTFLQVGKTTEEGKSVLRVRSGVQALLAS
jgi:hypothetical protein